MDRQPRRTAESPALPRLGALWRSRRRVSIAVRLGLLFAGTTALTLAIAATLFARALNNEFLAHDQIELQGKMDVLRETLAAQSSYEGIARLQERMHNTVMAGHPHSALTVVEAGGTPLLVMGQPSVVAHLLSGAESGKVWPITWSSEDRTYRIATEDVPLGVPAGKAAIVTISFDITESQRFLRNFRRAIWLAVFIGTVVISVLGWTAVRKGLAPLGHLSVALADMSTAGLDRPIPVDDVPTDLRKVIVSFNHMLVRLEDSFLRLSSFSADIAHELRTPINNMMLQAQVVLSRRRDVEEYCSYLQSNLEELRRLSRMIEDMLFLAKADNRLLAPQLEAIDVNEEVRKLVDFFEIAASERNVQLRLSGERAAVDADRLMFQRALSNVISNALRFTAAGSAIGIEVRARAGRVLVEVSNPGPDIPPEHLGKIFDRFYRVDASRREGETCNVGLGLAITKSIMEVHGGSVGVDSGAGRTRFTLSFPQRARREAREGESAGKAQAAADRAEPEGEAS